MPPSLQSYPLSGGLTKSESYWKRGIFWLVISALAIAFAWINFRTAMSIGPWSDDVMQVDAAINLHLGKGWTSSAWYSQSQYEFWAANNPLFTFLVYIWVSAFGILPAVVRSMNYPLLFVCIWLIVDACAKSGILRSPWSRCLLAILIACDQAVCYVYRTGRADLATMLILSFLFWAYVAHPDMAKRCKLLFIGSLFVVAGGIQSIPCIAILFAIEILLSRKLHKQEIASVILGTATGGALLAGFYLIHGVLKAFVAQTFASNYNLFGVILQAIVFHDKRSFGKLLDVLGALAPNRVLIAISENRSSIPLLILLCVIVIVTLRNRHSGFGIAVAGLATGIAVPYGMFLAGRYAFYYSWMGSVPVAIAAVTILERCIKEKRHTLSVAAVIAVSFAVLLGMPLQVFRQVKRASPTSYALVSDQLRQLTHPGDVLYGDPVFYYAAKMDQIEFMSSTYGGGRGYPNLAPQEAASVSIVAVRDVDTAGSLARVGGKWTEIGQTWEPYGFALHVFRRAAPSVSVPR